MLNRNKIERMLENEETTISKLIDAGKIIASGDYADTIKKMFKQCNLTVDKIAEIIANMEYFSDEVGEYIYFCDRYSDIYTFYFIVGEFENLIKELKLF